MSWGGKLERDGGLRKKAKALREKMLRTAQSKSKAKSTEETAMAVDPPTEKEEQVDWQDIPVELFPPDQIATLKSAMEDLMFEEGISELLQRNAVALRTLVDLQRARLSLNKKVESGGEEETLGELSA